MQGFQLKLVTGSLPPAVGALPDFCLDFITENKNDTIKNNKFNTTTTTEIFKFYKAAQLLMPRTLEIAFPSF